MTNSVRTNRLRALAILGGCAPVLVACATGFGSPTRHAIANLQAASTNLGTTLQIRDAIVALPAGETSAKGGVAYISFTAINLADQPDELMGASATVVASQSGSASSAAPTPAGTAVPASARGIPAKTGGGPGVAHVVVALEQLTAPVSQGQTLRVTLTFANSGTATDLLLPVQGASAVNSPFLPTAPPSGPASPTPVASLASGGPASQGPASSAPASPASSAAGVVSSPSPASSS